MSISEHRGLGDTVASVTKKLALDKLAEQLAALAGKSDCGCNKRQEQLNKLFPYNNSKNKPQNESNK